MLQLADLLPPTMPALPRLKFLSLFDGHLEDFSTSVAAGLASLTHLDLEGNLFSVLPPALSTMTTLKTLIMSHNHDMELSLSDVGILSALPGLETLSVNDIGCSTLEEKRRVVQAIQKRMPALKWRRSKQSRPDREDSYEF
jgi:Leucine-rich repeat (LRR) protein